jgi:hypothetical protein
LFFVPFPILYFACAKIINNLDNSIQNVTFSSFFVNFLNVAVYFDVRQDLGLFAQTVAKKYLPERKNALPLHRRKDKNTSKSFQDNGQKEHSPM